MLKFKTSNNEIITGDILDKALSKVAQDWRELELAIYEKDQYASHVTQETKINNLQKGLAFADSIKNGEISSFTIWQRVNFELTGECVAFLLK